MSTRSPVLACLWILAKAILISAGLAAARDWTIAALPGHEDLCNVLAVLLYAPLLSYLVLRPSFALLALYGLYPRKARLPSDTE
jgi:hypothetical protein